MQAPMLSEAAANLLRLRARREAVPVTDETRPAYRELAAAGLMVAGHTFQLGRESVYKFTTKGWAMVNAPSRAESA